MGSIDEYSELPEALPDRGWWVASDGAVFRVDVYGWTVPVGDVECDDVSDSR